MQTPAPDHDYAVGYRRVPTGIVYQVTFRETTVQKILEAITEMEADEFQAEVVYITRL